MINLFFLPFWQITEISIGPARIYTWGLMVGIGFLVGLWLTLGEARRHRLPTDPILTLAIGIFISAMVGSRLMYVILFWPQFQGDWLSVFKIWQGGMVYYGGFLAAAAFAVIYIKIKKLSFWDLADVMAVGLPAGLAIGRIGCSLINDHPGALTNFPWGIQWPNGLIRHPVAEYLVFAWTILFLIIWCFRSKVAKRGDLFVIFISGYSVIRFFLDFTRANDLVESDPRFFGLTISQIISLILMGGVMAYLIWIRPGQPKSDRHRAAKNEAKVAKKG